MRVADFGLARGLAEASWTEPAGGMLGTARYASPEQAMGVTLDARSDLYSLGLVLVESVTGKVPFAADTTIGMLTARTQRPLIAPDELGPLAAVVDRGGTISPDDRYPDAGTMRQALSDVADSLPPPGPLLLAGMVDHADPHPTRVATPVSPPLFDQDATEPLAAPAPRTNRDRKRDRKRWRNGERPAGQRRYVPWVVAVVLIATVAVAAFAFAGAGAGGASTISVPGFVGRSQAAAETLARSKGLTASVTTEAAPDPVGTVIDQSPDVGAWTSGTNVHLTVSTGPAKVAMPPILGEPWSKAQKQLDAIGFSYGTPGAGVQRHHAGRERVERDPAGGVLASPNATVSVVLSKGRAPINIPDVSGKTYAAAVTALHDQHLRSKRGANTFSNTVPEGQVVPTLPPSGQQAPYGSVSDDRRVARADHGCRPRCHQPHVRPGE